MKQVRWFVGLLLIISTGGCRLSRHTPPPSGTMQERAYSYLQKYAPLAVKEMRRSGVPASITLAQGMLESDYGRSKLAVRGNNHFGIKCKTDWQGRKIYIDDDHPNECFRRYPSVEDSYRDHSDFLRNNPRYRFLFLLDPTDYKGWAYGLKKAGYATNPQYAHHLIRLIEQYQLHRFDEASLRRAPMPKIGSELVNSSKDTAATITLSSSQPTTGWAIRMGHPLPPGVFLHNGIPAIRTRTGDTKWKIAVKYQLRPNQLLRYNDLPSSVDSFQSGLILYLKPKKKKGPKKYHVVNSGETIHWISQMYGVRLSTLRKYNQLPEGMEPLPGERLCLRSKCDPPPKRFNPSELPARSTPPPNQLSPARPSPSVHHPPADSTAPTFHVVNPGETLYQISIRYQTTVEELRRLNQLSPESTIHPGDTLYINPYSILRSPPPTPPADATYYEVQAGDTFYGIARRLNISIETLRRLNPAIDPTALQPGMKLRIR